MNRMYLFLPSIHIIYIANLIAIYQLDIEHSFCSLKKKLDVTYPETSHPQQYTTMNQNRLCVDCTQKKDKVIIHKREFNPPITGSTIPVDFCQKHLPIINFTTDT